MAPLGISRLGATGMSNHSTLQPSNPDRASEWPMGTDPNRAREPPMRTGPVARLSGVQVAERECDTVVNMTGGGPTSHTTLFRTPPPPPIKGRMARGSRIQLSTVDQGEIISTVRELHVQFRTPPPPAINDRTQGGPGMKPQP
jgi:hypothetical protein